MLEFALMSPVLIFLLLGLYDFSNGWITWRRLTTSANSVGQVASLLAVRADTTNGLTYFDAQRASTAAFPSLPQMFNAPLSEYAVTLSEVTFTTDNNCPKNKAATGNTPAFTDYCYAKVRWSWAFQGVEGAPNQMRPCNGPQNGFLKRIEDTEPLDNLGTLRASVFQVNPTLVVDVFYTFHPLFLQGFVKDIPMRWAAYFPARSGLSVVDQTIVLDPQGHPGALCPP